jgi:hypothetical protein
MSRSLKESTPRLVDVENVRQEKEERSVQKLYEVEKDCATL